MRLLPVWLATQVLSSGAGAAAQAAAPVQGYVLVVVESGAGEAAPDDVAATRRATETVEAALGRPAVSGAARFRRCGVEEGPLTPGVVAASFSRAQESFFLGRFDAAWDQLEQTLVALASGCRPLSSSVEAWRDPGPVAALHDLGALLLSTAQELERTGEAERLVRAVLAAFSGTRPTDGMFPPSLADRYLDLEPDATEVAWITVDAPGCEVNVGGRTAQGAVRVPAGEVRAGVRCGDDAFVLSFAIEAGSSVRVSAAPADGEAVLPRADRVLLRAAAAAASLARVDAGVALEAAGDEVRVALRRDVGTGGVWIGGASDPALGLRVSGFFADPVEEEVVVDEDVAGWVGPAVLGVAGLGLLAGGGWAAADAADRRELALQAATADEHDRLSSSADERWAAGWALIGVGAAAVAGAAIWLAVELAGGGEEDVEPAEPTVVPLLGPAVLGFEVAF